MKYNEDYFLINEAAKKLNVSNLDLIRYAANGKVSLCVVSGLLRYTLNFWFDNSSDLDDLDSLKIQGTTEFEFDGLVSLNQSDCRLIQQKGYIDNSIEVDRFDKLINFDLREEALLALIKEDARVFDKLGGFKVEVQKVQHDAA